MGTFNVTVRVSDSLGERFVDVEALVDTGSTYAAFPESLLVGLGITPRERGGFALPDNQVVEYPVGEAAVTLEGREFTVPVIFASEDADPLIGATTLEIFRLGIDPVARELIPVTGLRK